MIEKTVETKVKNKLDVYVNDGNAYYAKHQGNQYSKNGEPDYTGVVFGRFLGIESKAGNGHKLSLIQAFIGAKITSAKGFYIVAFPDFDTYETFNDMPAYRVHLTDIFKNAKSPLAMGDGEDYRVLTEFCKWCNTEKKTCRLVIE